MIDCSADDIVIGGSTVYDPSGTANDLALEAILAEWQSTADDYATRVTKIRAGVGAGRLAYGVTVLDDGTADVLSGGGGSDWFFQAPLDAITDRGAGEQIN